MPQVQTAFSKAFREYRNSLQISQRELGEWFDSGQPTVSHIEKGDFVPTRELAERIFSAVRNRDPEASDRLERIYERVRQEQDSNDGRSVSTKTTATKTTTNHVLIVGGNSQHAVLPKWLRNEDSLNFTIECWDIGDDSYSLFKRPTLIVLLTTHVSHQLSDMAWKYARENKIPILRTRTGFSHIIQQARDEGLNWFEPPHDIEVEEVGTETQVSVENQTIDVPDSKDLPLATVSQLNVTSLKEAVEMITTGAQFLVTIVAKKEEAKEYAQELEKENERLREILKSLGTKIAQEVKISGK